jgi:Alpha/beta hydrolase domain
MAFLLTESEGLGRFRRNQRVDPGGLTMETTTDPVSRALQRKRRVAVALVTLTIAAVIGALPTPAGAVTTPVPTVVHIPTTATSQPYGSNDAGVAGLAASGYVQEEYFISGTATGTGLAYTTRMLVRRPANPVDFSGTVIAESIRSTATRSMWSLRDYITRSGHAYVEIGSNVTAINNLVKPSNPSRYGTLNFPATLNAPPAVGGVFGHVMEVMAQGGMLLKANPAEGPFDGFDVNHVILAGCSEQGLIIRQYMRDAHPRYRTSGGRSIYDGYFPACVADWPSQFILINGVPFANFTPGRIEVPVINFTGQMEVENYTDAGRLYRRPDANSANDKYRIYEVAGMGHGLSQSSTVCAAGQQPSQFTSQYVSNNALDKLIRWVDRGIAPPRGERLAVTSPSGPLVKDATGNAVGGVRSYQINLPVATYNTGMALCTWQVPFSAAKLRSLYGNERVYLSQVDRDLHRLTVRGWILPEDAESARSDAVATAAKVLSSPANALALNP